MGRPLGNVYVTAERSGKYLAHLLGLAETEVADARLRDSQRSAPLLMGNQGRALTRFGRACAADARKPLKAKTADSISIEASGFVSGGRISNAS